MKSVPFDTFDAVILARDLPDMSGLDVLDAVRPRNQALPIMVVTCRGAADDAVHALERGADDFLFKPTRHPELLARLDALMWRKTKNLRAGQIYAAPYAFNLGTRSATMHGESVELAPRHFHLATLFFGKPGILLSRNYLLETVWGPESGIKARTLDFHVSQLRLALKLPQNNWRISSVYAHGYRLEPMAHPPAAKSPGMGATESAAFSDSDNLQEV